MSVIMSLRVLLCLAAGFALTGCIYLDRSASYQQANSLAPLKVPADMPPLDAEPLYPIPAVKPRTDTFVDVAATGKFQVPRPEPIDVDREQAKVKLQRVGEARWILLEAPASQVWPLTQSFLLQRGIRVARSHPASGLIETDWVEFNNDPANRSRFRLNIEQGIRPETTEIRVLHARRPSSSRVDTWPDRSSDEQMANAMLEDLANELALEINNRSASLLGQNVGGQVKAELVMDGREPSIKLRLTEARATATVSHALRSERFKLWGSAANGKVFYLNYMDPDAGKGWFRWFRSDEVPEQAPHTMEQILTRLSPEAVSDPLFNGLPVAAGDALSPQLGHLLVLTPAEGGYLAKLRDVRGRPVDVELAKRVLTEVRRELL